MLMTPSEMENRIVRYGALQPCRTAFIDAHTCALLPGLDVSINPSMSGEASLFRVVKTDDPAGPTKALL